MAAGSRPGQLASEFPRSARERGAVVALGPGHDTRLAAVAVSTKCSPPDADSDGDGTEEAPRILKRKDEAASRRAPGFICVRYSGVAHSGSSSPSSPAARGRVPAGSERLGLVALLGRTTTRA